MPHNMSSSLHPFSVAQYQHLSVSPSNMSIESLLREKSFLQSRLKQLELEIQEKEYYYQEIQNKSQQNHQLSNILAEQFANFKSKHFKINQEKDILIQKLNQQLSTYQHSQQSFTQQLSHLQSTILKLTQENSKLKKQIIQKNIFIEFYLKKNKQYLTDKTNKKQLSTHKKKIFNKQSHLNQVKTQLFESENPHQQINPQSHQNKIQKQ